MSKRNAGTDSRRPTPDTAGGLAEYLAAAAAYLARGWRVVPLLPLRKAPSQVGWPQLRMSVEELRGWARHFTFDLPARWPNLGLILGEASGGLVDVDCDCAEARAAAPSLLPATGRVFGRTSSAASHYLYVVTDGAPEKRVAFTWAEGEGGGRGHQWPALDAGGDGGRGHQWPAQGQDGLKAESEGAAREHEASASGAACAGPSGPRAGTDAPFHTIIGGVDWGYTHPTAALVFGLDGDGRAWQLDEFYQRRAPLDGVVLPALCELTRRWGVRTWYGGPDEPEHLAALQRALLRAGLACRVLAANDRVRPGIQTVTRLLARRDDGTRGLYVAPRCVHTIAEYGLYQWEPEPLPALPSPGGGSRAGGDMVSETPLKQHDDAMDATRYALHTALGESLATATWLELWLAHRRGSRE